jgi:hypothetical protein
MRSRRRTSESIASLIAAGQMRKCAAWPRNKGRLPGARSSKQAESAVELRPVPQARHAAHPQERSLIAGSGSTVFPQT